MSTTFLPRGTNYCKGCPLESTPEKSKHVPTEVVKLRDKPGVDVFFIGEAPGENEAAECRPFIGKSGKYIRSIVSKYANCNYAIGNATRCLEGSTIVLLEDGSWQRIDQLVKTKYKGKVWSVDKNDRLCLNSVVGWYTSKLGNRSLYKVYCPTRPTKGGRKRRSILTNDHEIKTNRGWVKIEDLKPGDLVCVGDGLSRVAKDILIGSLLGDGSMANASSYLRIVHGVAQKEWCDLKGKALCELGAKYGTINHRTERGGDYTTLVTESTYSLSRYKKQFYPHGGKRTFPKSLRLNKRILAVWFLDNGYTKIQSRSEHRGRQPLSEIACHSLTVHKINELVAQLNSRWKLGAYRGSNTNSKRIYFGVVGTKKLSKVIASFTPPSMRYKLHPSVEKEIRFDPTLYNPGPRKSLYTKVFAEKVTNLGRPRLKKNGELRSDSGLKKVYCIDVKGTHNFITPAGVVHNCRPTDKDGNNRAPTQEERARCFQYTVDHIHKLKPKKVIALGGVATGAFIDGFRSVAAIRGQSIPWKSPKGFELELCPTYHPAARDMYQLSFIPKDVRRAFHQKTEKEVRWDRPGKEVILDDIDKVRKLLRHISRGLKEDDVCATDVETLKGLNRLDNRFISISFSWDGVTGYSFPLDHPQSPWTPAELKKIKKWLRRLFSDTPKFAWWEAHNAKFEIQQFFAYLGIWVRNRPFLDTMLLAFLNDENRLALRRQMSPYSLKQLSAEKLGLPYEDEKTLGARERGELHKLPWRDVCKYNCLHYGVPVILEDGSTAKIGDIVREKRKVKVLSYGKNGIEAKPIVNWFQNHEAECKWVQIKLEGVPGFKSRQLVVTPDHGVFTDHGKTRADEIRKGDKVLINERILSKYERSAMLGSLMGDASLLTSPSQRKDWKAAYSAMFKCGHVESSGIAQWKIGVLRDWISWREKTKKCKAVWKSTGKEYTRNPFINFGTKHFLQLAELSKICYRLKGKKRVKTVTKEWLEELGPVGMAWWFMDDGFKNGKTVALSTNGFDRKSLKLLESWFTKRFGHSYVCKYGVLRLGIEATHSFCRHIAKHLPEPARYKLPEGKWNAFVPPTLSKSRKAYTVRVKSIGKYVPSRVTRSDIYFADNNFCIEVKDNHNFFTPFGLVSNCEDAWKTRRLHDKEKEEAGDYWETILRLSKYIYAPSILMFAIAERNGFKIDIDLLYELQSPNSPVLKAMKAIDLAFRKNKDVIAVNKKLVNEESGGMTPMFGAPWVFSLDKKAHLVELFVKSLKLEPLRFTEKSEEPALDTEYYEAYKDDNPLAKMMVERQEIKKLMTSYFNQIRGYLENDPECADGRVRPSFHLSTTVTGRTCVAKGTLIEIARDVSEHPLGIPIEQVKPGDYAYCVDDELKTSLRRVKWSGKTGVKPVVRVHWRTGRGGTYRTGFIDVTSDHKLRLTNGEYIKVEDLKKGDKVIALARGIERGYARLWVTGNKEISRENKFIRESIDGKVYESVHHKNGNKADNRPTNLVGMSRSDHTSLHESSSSPSKRKQRSLIMKKLWKERRNGMLKYTVQRGSNNGSYLNLSKKDVLGLLRQNGWSITKASRAGGYDFNSFKRHVVRNGFDLEELKYRVRELRRNHEITKIEKLPGKVEVFDLEIEGEHNFFAGELCVHNSCTEPNLQQIPRAESDYAKAAKNMFTVEPGNVLISADLAQGEVFLMAQTTKDRMFAERIWRMKKIKDKYWEKPSEKLKVILDTECDVHRQSASILYGVPIAKVTKEQRSAAKSIVTFGIIYGKHIKTIASDLKVSEEQARQTQEKFFSKFKDSKKGLLQLEDMAVKRGFVESAIGRRRRLPSALSPDRGEMNRALRQARNSPIQSLLSDYTLYCAGRLNEYIFDHGLDWKIVDVVHDAVITEVPFADAKRYVKVARRIMTDTESFAKDFGIEMIVPMLVDFDLGVAYGSMTAIDSWSDGDHSLRFALKGIRKLWKEKGYEITAP